jgi:LmbE family N-acetylglucosaminyl deacetylase
MNKNIKKIVLAIGSHPDDVEILSAGTLALLKEKGWQIEIATMTNGNLGSATLPKKEISEIRKNEATLSAKLLNGNYHCLDNGDVFLMYDPPTLLKTINLIRKIKPDLVITQSQKDYMVDHEVTGRLVQTACFSAAIKNIKTEYEPYNKLPYLYYMDALEGKDIYGNEIRPTTMVDITSTMDIKEKMLKMHDSQRSWLKEHHGIDEYIITMKNFAKKRGKEINVKYAEGFRQHLGHAYPDKNILEAELSKQVHLL